MFLEDVLERKLPLGRLLAGTTMWWWCWREATRRGVPRFSAKLDMPGCSWVVAGLTSWNSPVTTVLTTAAAWMLLDWHCNIGKLHWVHGTLDMGVVRFICRVYTARSIVGVTGKDAGGARADRPEGPRKACGKWAVGFRNLFVGHETGHAKRWMRAGGGWDRERRAGPCRRCHGPALPTAQRCPATPQPIPLVLWHAILVDGIQSSGFLVLTEALQFLDLHLLASGGESANNGSSAADGVGFGLGFGLFLLGDDMDLVQVTCEDGCVWHIFGRFGKLEKDDAGANGKETKDYGDDGGDGSLESLEQDGRRDDGGAGKVDVVCRRHHGSVEKVQGFL